MLAPADHSTREKTRVDPLPWYPHKLLCTTIDTPSFYSILREPTRPCWNSGTRWMARIKKQRTQNLQRETSIIKKFIYLLQNDFRFLGTLTDHCHIILSRKIKISYGNPNFLEANNIFLFVCLNIRILLGKLYNLNLIVIF